MPARARCGEGPQPLKMVLIQACPTVAHTQAGDSRGSQSRHSLGFLITVCPNPAVGPMPLAWIRPRAPLDIKI